MFGKLFQNHSGRKGLSKQRRKLEFFGELHSLLRSTVPWSKFNIAKELAFVPELCIATKIAARAVATVVRAQYNWTYMVQIALVLPCST